MFDCFLLSLSQFVDLISSNNSNATVKSSEHDMAFRAKSQSQIKPCTDPKVLASAALPKIYEKNTFSMI